MSSSSDSEIDDERISKFLAAADTNFLTNDLYQKSTNDENTKENLTLESEKQKQTDEKEQLKSQRYLNEDEVNIGADLNLSQTMQTHFYNKLKNLLRQQIEFEDNQTNKKPKIKAFKSRIKLLNDADCYVKSYEDFTLNSNEDAPKKKPIIKRRQIDDITLENGFNDVEHYRSVAISGDDIIAGADCKHWSKKSTKSKKLYTYKSKSDGLLHELEVENEFTKLRKKNNWNESKISKKKFKS